MKNTRVVQIGLAAMTAVVFSGASCGELGKDTDKDGVPDAIDQCPNEPGPWDNLGCPVIPPGKYDCANPPALAGFIPVKDPVPDRLIVRMKLPPGRAFVVATSIQALASKYGVANVIPLAQGFAGTIKAREKAGGKLLSSLLRDPSVQYVSQVSKVHLIEPKRKTAASVPWDLDRIDARKGLDGAFNPSGRGKGVHVAINDTGVTEVSETKGRVSPQCFSTVVFRGCEDGHGHGTFVSSEAAGLTLGVLSEATLHSLRFLGEDGSGTSEDAIRTLEKLIEWKLADPSVLWVVNASWGGSPDPPIDDAACRVIAAGIPFIAAAGNESDDAYTSSPARVEQALTVLATDENDKPGYFTNYGAGIDVGAPGVNVVGMLPSGATEAWDGTSMAAPLVTAAAGLYLETHPSATVAEVHDFIVSNSTKDALSELPEGTPNRLLFVGKEGGDGETPPKGTPVGADRLLRTSGATVVDRDGKRMDLFQGILCCRTPVVPTGAKPLVRRPRPVWVKGVEINARWPCIGREAMDFLHGYRADDFHCRLGPFYADEETESDFLDIGGPYLADGSANPAFWQFTRDQAWHAYKIDSREEVVPLDPWGFKFSQAGGRYVPFPQDVIDAFGHEWRPEFERHLRLVVENLGCYGNVYIALDNEGTTIRNYDPEFYRTMLRRYRELEQEVGCGFRKIVGTSIPELFGEPDIDYTITHSGDPLTAPVAGKWRVANEHNPAFPPSIEEGRFRGARGVGLLWSLWRDDMEDVDFYDTLHRFKRVVEGSAPPPPQCSLGTPTARQMAAAGRQPTIRVQRTVAGAGPDPLAGKWITGTPVACFGSVYYCQPGMNWPEACAQPPCPGPVAPEGHPQRVACEAQFLEQPCPTFAMDRCTGTGEQCPITFDTYIVIDGVNQLHPDNVKAGCREATYIKDPNGRLLSGEWWKATAHGKGYLKACNADGSVCGISFEIDQ